MINGWELVSNFFFVSGISPETDPLSPPEAGKNLIPNFDSAWEQALSKAKELISNFSVEEKVFTTIILILFNHCVIAISIYR